MEDDPGIRETVALALGRWDFETMTHPGSGNVADWVLQTAPDLLVLDVKLPSLDGFEWCRRVRARSGIPVIIISARDSTPDALMGLASGADDYVAKPFSVEVLVARIRASIRRAYEYGTPEGSLLVHGPLVLDTARASVSAGETQCPLTKNEFLILACLVRARGGVVGREELAQALWRDEVFVDDNTLTVNVSRLRQKLATLGLPDTLETLKGRGYRLS